MSFFILELGVGVYAYFKLFNSIKDEHEVEFARLELESLVGQVEEVRNFSDELRKSPLGILADTTQVNVTDNESDDIRFQDYLIHELAYGKVQGFISSDLEPKDIRNLVTKLGYTREIYVVSKEESWEKFVEVLGPSCNIGKNCNIFSSDGMVVVRIITNQYFLENSEYILKVTPTLSRKKVQYFTDRLFENLMQHIYRIPASARARVGKRFLDYLAERDEASRYLSHGLHPYKGKFHPKMTRALINIIRPDEGGTLIDNFAGSGTLLVEANLMGFNSYGIEINPMSVLMANTKCALLTIDLRKLDTGIQKFLKTLDEELNLMHQELKGQTTIETRSYFTSENVLNEIESVSEGVFQDFTQKNVLDEIIIARLIITNEFMGSLRDILLLSLAIAISSLKGKKNKDFRDHVKTSLEDIYRRALILKALQENIPLKVGVGKSYEADSGNFKKISKIMQIQGNVNSPPYSTALDYVKNDLSQLAILGLIRTPDDLASLEERMGGNPRRSYDSGEMEGKINTNPAGLPDYAMRVIKILNYFDKNKHAYRLYEFFDLLKRSLSEQIRILEKGARIATVIGNNHFKISDEQDILTPEGIIIDNVVIPISIIHIKENVHPVDPKPIRENQIQVLYSDELPAKVSIVNNTKKGTQNGVYIEIENERVVFLLARDLGFKPYLVINRLLEKTQRGNIRYESIVIMEKI